MAYGLYPQSQDIPATRRFGTVHITLAYVRYPMLLPGLTWQGPTLKIGQSTFNLRCFFNELLQIYK